MVLIWWRLLRAPADCKTGLVPRRCVQDNTDYSRTYNADGESQTVNVTTPRAPTPTPTRNPPFALHIQSVKFSGLFLPSITSIQRTDETHIDRCQPALMWLDMLLNNRVTLHISARPVPFSEAADAAFHLEDAALDPALQREASTTYCGDDGSLNVHTQLKGS